MDSHRWKQLDDLLQLLLERPPQERDAFLKEISLGDAALEREVRALFSMERDAVRFLETPALEVAARALGRQDRGSEEDDGLPAGMTVSHYVLLERIGAARSRRGAHPAGEIVQGFAQVLADSEALSRACGFDPTPS